MRRCLPPFLLLPAAAFAAGEAFRDCPDCPEMVVIPAGEFRMGSADAGPDGRREEGPQHRVVIGYAFAMSRFEVTWNDWQRCVAAGACPEANDEGYGRGEKPVINVSLGAAREYARWLSASTGYRYRLPSEAEWEYAARAGSSTERHWGDGEAEACVHANVFNPSVRPNKKWKWRWAEFACEDGYNETAPVGRFRANAFGLHDMLGNVREWTEDCFDVDYAQTPADGSPARAGECRYHVTRGGSWVTEPIHVRSASRYWVEPTNRNDDLGIRLVRELP